MSLVRRSIFFSFLDKYSVLLINFVSTIALARILSPNDIGIFSIAASLIGFAGMLRDFGIGTYLIQEKELTLIRQRSAMGVAIVIAWTIGAVLACLSSVIGDFYRNPGVGNVVLILSLNFFLIPFSTIVVTILRREMNFGALYRIGLAVNISRAASAVGLAWLGFGFLAMAWSSVVGLVVIVIMAQFEHPASGRLLPSLKEWRHVISFGTLSTAAQVLIEIKTSAPEVLIGRIINPLTVGLYSRANGLLQMFNQSVLDGLMPVALSTIAMRHREGQDVRGFVLQSLTHITALGWPFFSFVAIFALPIMRILFGDQWDGAVPLVEYLCVAAIIRLIDSVTWPVLQGTGRIRNFVTLQAVTVPLQVAILLVALLFWSNLAAIGWASIISALVQSSTSLYFLRSATRLSLGDIFGAVAKSAGLAVASSALPVVVAATMPIDAGHTWPPLLLATAGAASGFLIAVVVLKHPLATEIKRVFRQGWRAVLA